MSSKITARDIADKLGVSRSTVSRAFDPMSRISPDVRRRILKTAHELGYRPTTAARLTMQEYPHIVALIVRDITNPVRATILTQLIRELERNRLLPLVFQVPNARAASARAETILGHLPSAVVMTGFMPSSSLLTLCSQRGTPTLVVNRGRVTGLAANFVTSDHYDGGYSAAKFLVSSGCRRIGFVTGHSMHDPDASEARMNGFLAGLEEADQVAAAAFEGDHSYKSGADAATGMMQRPIRPDGVFCGNDMMAMGFKDAALERYGLRAPDDYQLIGYDDVEMADWLPYRLTTFRQDMSAVIRASTDAIKHLIETPEVAVRKTVPVALVERSTTCRTLQSE